MVLDTSATPAWLRGFFDDTAVFPPASTPVDRAVAEHRAHRDTDCGPLAGRFVVPDLKVPDLIDALDEAEGDDGGDRPEEPLDVGVLVTGGAGAIAPAVRWASRAPVLRLRKISLVLRDEDDLARNAQRVVAALGAVEEDLAEVEVYVELPRSPDGSTHRWLPALDELAAAELRATFRTTGSTPEDLPSPAELAGWIDAALDREMPFGCTGGAPGAVSGTSSYGFLNLLAATECCLEGGDAAAALVATADDLLGGTDAAAWERARRWCSCTGTSDLLAVHEDLVDLGLITPA